MKETLQDLSTDSHSMTQSGACLRNNPRSWTLYPLTIPFNSVPEGVILLTERHAVAKAMQTPRRRKNQNHSSNLRYYDRINFAFTAPNFSFYHQKFHKIPQKFPDHSQVIGVQIVFVVETSKLILIGTEACLDICLDNLRDTLPDTLPNTLPDPLPDSLPDPLPDTCLDTCHGARRLAAVPSRILARLDMLFDLSALVPRSQEGTARPAPMLNVLEGIHQVREKAKETCQTTHDASPGTTTVSTLASEYCAR